jgi:PTS system galactitol-specific IIA component
MQDNKMQLNLADLLREEHIILNIQAGETREALVKLSKPLVETGSVEPEFAEDVWEREQVYPTGLPTKPFPVAIPHADPDHVKQTAVCFGTLLEPVPFSQMGGDESTILSIRTAILLAIKEREKQTEMIQQVIGLIQNGDFVTALQNCASRTEAYLLIKETLES